jgi:hypothetical protein
MNTLQFEAVKVALKQDKTGYVLTLCLHPDEIPEELLRDFVGARYQVVMVRLDSNEQPMDRHDEFAAARAIKMAGALCKDEMFYQFLSHSGYVFLEEEQEVVEWLRNYLKISSRSELKTDHEARVRLEKLNAEYGQWKKR